VFAAFGSKAALLRTVLDEALAGDDEVARLWVTVQDNRRAGATMVVEHARRTGPLRRGLRTARAIDLLWFLDDPAHYQALVTDCGWPPKVFTTWLARQMRSNLLA
jgi:hypothetical protein